MGKDRGPTVRLRMIDWNDLTEGEVQWILDRLGAVRVSQQVEPKLGDSLTAEQIRAMSDEELAMRLDKMRKLIDEPAASVDHQSYAAGDEP